MKVAIIGAGVAGLCLAIRLARQGHRPTVYEQRSRSDLASTGLFLTLAPKLTRALADLGPLADLTDHGIITTAFSRALRRLILPWVLPLGERSSRALLAAAPRSLMPEVSAPATGKAQRSPSTRPRR